MRGFLGRLFGRRARDAAAAPALEGLRGFGYALAGVEERQAALRDLVHGRNRSGHRFPCETVLAPDPASPAVLATIAGVTVGRLPDGDAAAFRAFAARRGVSAARCRAVIVGGRPEARRGERDPARRDPEFRVMLSLRWPPALAAEADAARRQAL